MMHGVRKLAAIVIAGALASTALAGCTAGGSSSRTIEVDYRSDEFAGAFLGYFPREVTVRPGMNLKFHQTWSGEAHSVTFAAGLRASNVDSFPPFVLPSGAINQTAAFPCYVNDIAALPLDFAACSKAQQTQPEFTGQHAYYSSGFIPFEGPQGNTFEMTIADDAKDGTYFYYCTLHGARMSGEIKVDRDADLESQASMNKRGSEEADRLAAPLLEFYEKEKAGAGQYKGNLAGSGDASTKQFGSVNEFTPRTIRSAVNQPVTWTFVNGHNLSFEVPPYAPVYKLGADGRLEFNNELKQPKGWPGPPGPAAGRKPVHIDAGKWDGSGGWHSTGSGWNTGDTYTITFTKPGSYLYACSVHPGMIGKVVVS
jgi:plastocyanin